MVLIILHQEQKGRSIIKELYDKEPNADIKQMYQQYMNMSREDLINGKTVSSTTVSENAN